MPESDSLRILTVHAHPDDEASKGAPTLAMYAAEGVHTVLVCCTGGEEGDIQNPARWSEPRPAASDLAEVRAAELARSAADHRLRRGRDARLPRLGHARHRGQRTIPATFANADLDEASGRLVAVIRRTAPQVLITYGDDQQGYPHPDHLRVHDISVLAFDRAGDPTGTPSSASRGSR